MPYRIHLVQAQLFSHFQVKKILFVNRDRALLHFIDILCFLSKKHWYKIINLVTGKFVNIALPVFPAISFIIRGKISIKTKRKKRCVSVSHRFKLKIVRREIIYIADIITKTTSIQQVKTARHVIGDNKIAWIL